MTPADVPDPKPDTTVTIEHLRGRAQGGGSNFLNTAASCLGCNQRRSRQRQVGKKTVPRVKVSLKIETTYAVTTPSDPETLLLYNSGKRRDDALLDLRKIAGEPITLMAATILDR